MSPSHSIGRVALSGFIFVLLAACHHGTTPSSSYVGASSWDTPEPASEAARSGRPAPPDDSARLITAPEVRSSRIEDLFTGRFPGLDVRRTSNGDLSMRFRGAEPLVVIDGLEADPVALVSIHPATVKRIEVLRGVTDTAIYGSRGVNGVVIVTTGDREDR